LIGCCGQVAPQTPYGATLDGSLPQEYKRVLDPLDALTFVAGHTKTIVLGTSVLDIPYYSPVMLARRVTTLDVLSSGRVRLGLGLGWSKDEHDAVGASMAPAGFLGRRVPGRDASHLDHEPRRFTGTFYTLPRSVIETKPVQKPHPPIYMGAFVPAALKRIARLADGWNPVGIPVDRMHKMFEDVKQMAREAGRDPSTLQLVVRANVEMGSKPRPKDGAIFTGTVDQIKADIDGCKRIGAHEVHFDPTFMPGAQTLEHWPG
jgi:alkanesulfonate monooxygenase SsuD/methylene tetrahydromethanopterin reductase-like flavin-dependent oxidoreductase (luciferase family)